ncbi:MAG: class I SAM-dependent methyltransferase, partial [Acidobacteriota bacterium]
MRPLRLSLAIVFCLLASLACSGSPRPPADVGEGYTTTSPSRGGLGKVYMGREIAQYLSYHGIPWLEREDRVESERPDEVVKRLGLKPTDVVADIGAGSGYFSLRMARVVSEGRVLAVDIQPEMLEALDERQKALGLSNIEGVLGSVESPNLPAASVDLVLMVDAYHEFSHPIEMMRGIVESLKPGGRVVLIEYRGEDTFSRVHPLHKMTELQVRREMKAAGLRWLKTLDFLPEQHMIVFGL